MSTTRIDRRSRILKDIVRREPNSNEANVARIRLQEMGISFEENEEDGENEDSTYTQYEPDDESDDNETTTYNSFDECDEHDVLISPARWKYMNWRDYDYRYRSTKTFKTSFKAYLKRKNWLENDVISSAIAKDIHNLKKEYLLHYTLTSVLNTITNFKKWTT